MAVGRTVAGSHWVSAAAGLCALHCLGTPLLALALPALAGHGWERWVLLGTLPLVVPLAVWGYRSHRRPAPGLLLAVGLSLWAGSIGGLLAPAPEVLTSFAGSLLTAISVFWNGRLHHLATCPVHGTPVRSPGSGAGSGRG